jgi:hypothetical protein
MVAPGPDRPSSVGYEYGFVRGKPVDIVAQEHGVVGTETAADLVAEMAAIEAQVTGDTRAGLVAAHLVAAREALQQAAPPDPNAPLAPNIVATMKQLIDKARTAAHQYCGEGVGRDAAHMPGY